MIVNSIRSLSSSFSPTKVSGCCHNTNLHNYPFIKAEHSLYSKAKATFLQHLRITQGMSGSKLQSDLDIGTDESVITSHSDGMNREKIEPTLTTAEEFEWAQEQLWTLYACSESNSDRPARRLLRHIRKLNSYRYFK